jgi:hypothetical protein
LKIRATPVSSSTGNRGYRIVSVAEGHKRAADEQWHFEEDLLVTKELSRGVMTSLEERCRANARYVRTSVLSQHCPLVYLEDSVFEGPYLDLTDVPIDIDLQ